MHLDVVVLGPYFDPAAEVFRAKGTYTRAVEAGGTVAEGTFDFTFEERIDPEGNGEGLLTINSGAGGRANLQGRPLLAGTAGVDGDNSGKVQFRAYPATYVGRVRPNRRRMEHTEPSTGDPRYA